MDIKQKTLGIIIDELVTVLIKEFMIQEQVNNPNISDEELGKAFRKVQTLNARRNKLINAIDEYVNQAEFSTTEKSYK